MLNTDILPLLLESFGLCRTREPLPGLLRLLSSTGKTEAMVGVSSVQFSENTIYFLDLVFRETTLVHSNLTAPINFTVEGDGATLISRSFDSFDAVKNALSLPEDFERSESPYTIRYVFVKPLNGGKVMGRKDWLLQRFQGVANLDIYDIAETFGSIPTLSRPVGLVIYRPVAFSESLDVLFQRRLCAPPLVAEGEVCIRTLAIITIGDNYGFSNYDLRKTLFNSAEGLNLRIVVVDRADHWLTDEKLVATSGMPLKHRPFAFIPFDFADLSTVDVRLTRCLHEWQDSDKGVKLDGIFTFRDNICASVARTAVALGLPVPAPSDILQRCINKADMRNFIQWKGQGSRTITKRDDIAGILNGLEFPAIIKPQTGNGSLGVFKVVSAEEIYELWDHITFPSAVAVVEPYIGGTEVDVDLVVEKGRLLYFNVTDNDPTIGDDNRDYQTKAFQRTFTETAMLIPTILPSHIQLKLRDACYDAILRIGLEEASGVFNVEARIGNFLHDLEGPVFIVEINVRCPGSNFPLLVQRTWGVDQYGCAFLAALGRPLAIACQPFNEPLAYGCVTWVHSQKQTVLTADPLQKVRGRPDLLSASSWPVGFSMADGPDWIAKLYTISSTGRDDCVARKEFLESQIVQSFEGEIN